MHKLLSLRLLPASLVVSLLLLGSTLAFEKETGTEVTPPEQNSISPISLVQNDDGSYRLTAKGVSASELIQHVAAQTGISITADDVLARQIVSVDETHADLESLIKSISDSNAIVFERHGDEIRLVSAFVSSQQADPPASEEEELAILEAGGDEQKMVRGYKLTNLSPDTEFAKLNQDRMLSLRNALIHTTRARQGVDIDVPAALAARPDTRWHIVQFEDKITAANRKALEAAGFKIGHYVPANALAVQADAARLAELKAIPGVYHVEAYHPYFKVSEDILGYLSGEAPAEIKDKVEEGRFTILTHQHELDLDAIQGLVDVEAETMLDGRVMIRASADPAALVQLAQQDAVQWMEVTPVFKALNDLGNQRMRANALKRRLPNLTGTGVVVAVTDSGIDFKHSDFAIDSAFPTEIGLNSRIKYYEYRPSFTSDGFPGDTDGHGTHVAGSILGSGYLSPTVVSSPGSKRNAQGQYDRYQFGGIAPGARVVMIEDFNSFTPGEQVAIAWSNEARIANNSWGAGIYKYSADSIAWDVLVRDALPGVPGDQEFVAFFAAGNDGGGDHDGTGGTAGTILTPGNAKNVITIGALEQPRLADNLPNSIARSDSDWQVASFSSRGPVDVDDDPLQLDDVRNKPDLVAPGVYILSTQSRDTNPDELTTPFSVNWDYRAGNVDSGTNYAFSSGTSMASPLATGVGALFMEYYKTALGRNPSPAMVKAALVGGARNVNTLVYRHPESPVIITRTVDQGWGLIDASRSVFGTGIHATDQMIMIDQEAALNTGEFFSRQITVNPGEGGLKIVLAWTDPPGNPAVERQLINDLDLLVLAPGGGGFVGNRFGPDGIHSARFAIASPVEGDPYNNVEVILVPDANPGTYTIRAYGTDVPSGPQDFAMFIMKGVGQERRFAGSRPSIAFNAQNRPHVAFSGEDAAGNIQVFVKQWRGDLGDLSDFGNWRRLDDNWFSLNNSAANVGISASLAPSLNPSIAVRDDKVYVAWEQHENNGTNIFVRYYNGTNWNALGTSASGLGISSNTVYAASKPVIRLDNAGNPVVAWRQKSLANDRIHVARWNGSAWVGYGASMTNGVGDNNQADNPTLTINSSGNPVVAWEELTTQKIHVYQWNGSSWVSLGQRGASPYASNPHLDSASNGDLYLTWKQTIAASPTYQVYAERRTGGSWVAMAGSASGAGVSAITNLSGHVYNPTIGYSPMPSPRVFVSWLTREGSNTTVNVKQHLIGSGSWTGISGSEKFPGVAVLPGANTNVVLAASPLGVPVVSFNNNGSAGISEVVSYGLVSDIIPPTFGGILSATGGTNQDVRLTWNAANDNLTVATNMRYNIYMGTNRYFCFDVAACSPSDVFGNLIATVTNVTSITVSNLTPYELRCFAVRAVDSVGNIDSNTKILFAGPEEPGVSCLERDTDGDGLPDWWEYTWFGSPTGASNSTLYATNCVGGLVASNSFVFGTDPFSCDSDADGITDANEVTAGTSPRFADTDGDGLDDADENAIGSDPLSARSNTANDLSDGDLIRLGYADPTVAIDSFNILYSSDFEVANLTASGWTNSRPNGSYPLNFWHVSSAKPVDGLDGVSRANDPSPTRSLRMAIDNTAAKTNAAATYNAGQNRWVAGLDSPLFDATAVDNLFITFKEYYELEANKDFVEVHARSAEQPNWVVVSIPKTGFSRDWEINMVDLSRFAGNSNVQVRLLFLANDVNNNHAGWYVDDVRIYSGLLMDGWVRDINGCAVQGANVFAIGVGIVTNTIDGHKVVQPGKVFTSATSALDGSYQLRGLPKGQFVIKVEHPSYRAEFWDGDLFSPSYAFGNLANPGVVFIDEVTAGVVDLTAGGPVPAVHFEVEPGEQKSLVGVAADSAQQIAVNYNQPVMMWNGSTNAAASTPWLAMTNLSAAFNNADWYASPMQPNYFGGLMPGVHAIGLTNRWQIPPARLAVRDGEYSRAGLVTNAGNGFLYAASLDGISWPVWINGVNSGRTTPALIQVQAGRHLVQLMGAQALTRAQTVDVPVGGRENVTFTPEYLVAPNASLVLRTFDGSGNEILGADILIDGVLVTTNNVAGLDQAVTPVTIPAPAGTYNLAFRKEGYKLSAVREYGALVDEVTYVYAVMYEDDRDFDGVGDATELDAFGSIYATSGLDDTDGDGLTNQQEFDFARTYGLYLDPLNPDTDGDGMLDGDEVGYDGDLNAGSHIMFAYANLSAPAIEDSNNLRIRFNGRYLDGIWNFGTNATIRLSVNGDIVEVPYADVSITFPATPSADCVEAVLTNIPAGILGASISRGEPLNTLVFADTNPSLLDTDGDGMWDGFEFNYQFMTNAFDFAVRVLDPIGAGANDEDPDADELSNYLEFLGPDGLPDNTDWTDPRTGDTDDDGMPDGWEYFYGFDPNDPNDAWDDPDQDMLVNLLEYQHGTNPGLYDTDADGLSDGEEVLLYGTNPVNPDTDSDGLFDGLEILLATDPLNWDTDGDGMPDAFEVLDALGQLRNPDARLNPLDPSDANEDYDGDGLSNLQEYLIRDGLYGNPPPGIVWDYSSDPFTADSDEDGMPDGWEAYYGLHPMDKVIDTIDRDYERYVDLGPAGDLDGDGLWNLREFQYRFRIDPSADPYAIFSYSTDPRNPDTDGDGLGDGEEDRIFATDAIRQDTDSDHLFDGAALEPRWGEVESTRRLSEFVTLDCSGCTWSDAVELAKIPHPNYPDIIGQLAVISSVDEYLAAGLALTGVETEIALGGTVNAQGFVVWMNGENPIFAPVFDELAGEPAAKPGYLGVDAMFMAIGRAGTNLFDHIMIEWENVPQITNHYDMAKNDLWKLVWPGPQDLPNWELVSVDAASPIPAPRWGHAAAYVPVYETKLPRDNTPDSSETAITLLDNRQLVIFGGRDGVTKYTDVWEFQIRSNMWHRSMAPLNGGLAAYFEGVSELSAITKFSYRNTAASGCDQEGDGFGLPKKRPYADSRSMDWTFLLGGWDNAYTYRPEHIYYKSTDDPRAITEYLIPGEGDAGVTEFVKDFASAIVTPPGDVYGASTLNEGTRFAIGQGVALVMDDTDDLPVVPDTKQRDLTGYSAFNIGNFLILGNCDRVSYAELVLEITRAPSASFDVEIIAEVLTESGSSETEYSTRPDELEPSLRWGGGLFFNTRSTNFAMATTTGRFTVDVTDLINDLISSVENWGGANIGFIFRVAGANDYAIINTIKSGIRVDYIPSYKIPPEWRYPTLVSTAYTVDPLSSRKSHALAYDYKRDRALLFGGLDGNRVLGDTHEGDLGIGDNPGGASWREIVSVDKPAPRYGHSMVYDAKNSRFLMFGGFDSNHRPLNDLWEFVQVTAGSDTNAPAEESSEPGFWREITEFTSSERPQPRGGAAMIYYGDFDYQRGIEGYCVGANKQQIVLFGGTDRNTYFNDTWVYNGSRWILVNPVGEQSQGPSPRAFASFVYAQNGRDLPDPDGAVEYRSSESPPCAAPTAFLFGGRTGTWPTGKDTDFDMVDDGVEHALGSTAVGRDPRVNALVEPTHPTETVPFSFNRIGSRGLLGPAAIANFESLRNRDGQYASGVGLPFEEYPDAESEGNEVIGPKNTYGVDAMHVSHINLWYHRAAFGDPNDASDVWQLGVPNNVTGSGNSAPPYAHSGRWVYGTRLNGNYPDDSTIDLFSPVFSLSLPAANSTQPVNSNSFFLVFSEWLDLADVNDYVQVDVIRPETQADVLTRVSGAEKPPVRVLGPRHAADNTTGQWRRVAVPLNISANEEELFLRFRLASDSTGTAGGWYIDDVAIAQGGEISGVVTNFGPGYTVNLHGANDGWIIEQGITSENGEFSFGLLPIGQYFLSGLSSTSSVVVVDSATWAPTASLPQPILEFSVEGFSLGLNALYWDAVPGAVYQPQYTDDLMNGWLDLGPPVTAVTTPEMVVDPNPILGQRFYRVILVSQP